MSRKTLPVLFGVLVIGTLALFWARYSDFASTPQYCPWNHRIGFSPWVCKVKDTQGGRVLVEHANLDTGRLELSIEHDGASHWIQHPEGHVTQFSNALDENKIGFDPADWNSLIVNGEKFPITYTREP
jgi:hypothetical protein